MKTIKRPSKRIIIILVIAGLLVITAVYAWQSLVAWKGYEARLLKEQASYQQLRTKALSGATVAERLAAIRQLDGKLDDRSRLCKMNPLFAWQASIVPPLGSGVRQCEDKLKQLNAIAGPLSSLRDYLDSAQKLQEVVKKLAPGESLTDKNWAQKGLRQAKDVQSQLKGLKGEGDAKTLNGKALDLSGRLVAAWESLITANDAKDKTAFITSSAAVIAAYADFASLADSADQAIQSKVKAVTSAASKL